MEGSTEDDVSEDNEIERSEVFRKISIEPRFNSDFSWDLISADFESDIKTDEGVLAYSIANWSLDCEQYAGRREEAASTACVYSPLTHLVL